MKLNKRDRQAFAALRSVLDAFEKGQSIELDATDAAAIFEVFGFNLKTFTSQKKHVKEFVRGKDDAHIVYNKPFSAWSRQNRIRAHGYFPFQIKSYSDEGRHFHDTISSAISRAEIDLQYEARKKVKDPD